MAKSGRKIDVGKLYFNKETFELEALVTIVFEDGTKNVCVWKFEPADPIKDFTEVQEQEFVIRSLKLTEPFTNEEWVYFKNQFPIKNFTE